MSIKKVLIIIVIILFVLSFQFLYEKQFGAVSFFLISIVSAYLAYREWKQR